MGWSRKCGRFVWPGIVILSSVTCRIWSGGAGAIDTLNPATSEILQFSPIAVATATLPATPEPTLTPSPEALPTFTAIVTTALPPTDTPIPRMATPTFTATPISQGMIENSATLSGTRVAGPIQELVAQSCPRRQACIFSPQTGSVVSNVVQFRGAATRPGFDYYKLEYQLEGTTEWHLIDVFDGSVIFGPLGNWQTLDVPSGAYLVRLTVVDTGGNYWPESPQVRLIVENGQEMQNRNPLDALQYKQQEMGGVD